MNDIRQRFREKGLTLPSAPQPVGSYLPLLVVGEVAYLSGQISKDADGVLLTGKAGSDLDIEAARLAARTAVLNALSLIDQEIGFDRFERVIRLVGYVQAAPDFYAIPEVLNAASDLLVDLFGEQGKHVRSAIAAASLPLNAAVEIELTVKIRAGR